MHVREPPTVLQATELRVPLPLLTKSILPVGIMAGLGLMSVTVAMHVTDELTVTELELHVTAVDVECLLTAKLKVSLPAEWLPSPPYATVKVWIPVPKSVGVYVTEQLPEGPRLQMEVLKEPAPVLVKLTVPDGVIRVPTAVSVTTALHAVGVFTTSLLGLQLTEVEVTRKMAIRLKLPPLPT